MTWIDEYLDFIEERGLIIREPRGGRENFILTDDGQAVLETTAPKATWEQLGVLTEAAERRTPIVAARRASPEAAERIRRQLDICEAAGFIERTGPHNFNFTPMGSALLNGPDPLGRDWMERMLDAASCRRPDIDRTRSAWNPVLK